jgi:hypothetical protein
MKMDIVGFNDFVKLSMESNVRLTIIDGKKAKQIMVLINNCEIQRKRCSKFFFELDENEVDLHFVYANIDGIDFANVEYDGVDFSDRKMITDMSLEDVEKIFGKGTFDIIHRM